jgi:hypothetical protein
MLGEIPAWTQKYLLSTIQQMNKDRRSYHQRSDYLTKNLFYLYKVLFRTIIFEEFN